MGEVQSEFQADNLSVCVMSCRKERACDFASFNESSRSCQLFGANGFTMESLAENIVFAKMCPKGKNFGLCAYVGLTSVSCFLL